MEEILIKVNITKLDLLIILYIITISCYIFRNDIIYAHLFTVPQQKNTNTVPKKTEKTEEEEDPINYERIRDVIEKEITFDNQLAALLNAVQLTEFELTTRYNVICPHLDEIFKSVFPECRTYKFGSTVAQLSFKESDLDIYMYVGRIGKKFSLLLYMNIVAC